MKTAVSNKTIWNVGYPIIFGNLAQTLISLTDTAFLGRVSTIALGASMIAGIYYYVFSTLAWGFAIGIQIIVARRLGEGKLDRIGMVFEHGLAFGLILSCLLFLTQHYCTDLLFRNIIRSPNIYHSAMEYIHYRHYGIIFVCFNFLFRALYIGLSNTKVITFCTTFMAAVNVTLNYVLIFGKWGFPEMGIGGAAIASVCAEISALLFFTIYTITKLPLKTYTLFAFHKFEGWLLKMILNIALPTMLQKLFSFGIWFLFFALIEHLGEGPIAISGIIRSIYMLITIPVFAFGATANTLASKLIGEGRASEVVATSFKTLRLSLICMIPLLLFCIIAPETVLSVYTNNPGLATASIPSLYVICISAIALNFGIIFFETVSGTGNTVYALILEAIILIIYAFAVWLFASVLHTKVEWVWSSEFIYGICLGLISFGYVKFANWQKKRI